MHFHIQSYGDSQNPPVVFLHGLMGFAQNWRRIISGFEKDYFCLAYDQRGHGRSEKPAHGYAPEDYAQDLFDILDQQQIPKCHLVGHSMGGRNALHAGFVRPELFKTITIVDIGPEEHRWAQAYFSQLLGLVPTPFASREAAKNFLMNEFPQLAADKEDPTALAQYFYANMIDQPDGSVNWRFSVDAIIQSAQFGRAQDRWHEVKGLSVPSLLIRGSRSKDLSPETYVEMLAQQPLMKGVVIEGAGHWVHADKPDEFTRMVRSFIDDNPL